MEGKLMLLNAALLLVTLILVMLLSFGGGSVKVKMAPPSTASGFAPYGVSRGPVYNTILQPKR